MPRDPLTNRTARPRETLHDLWTQRPDLAEARVRELTTTQLRELTAHIQERT